MGVEPGFQLGDLLGREAMIGWHVAEVHEDADGMGVGGKERLAGAVWGMAFGAEAKVQGGAVVGRGFAFRKLKAAKGLLGDMLADGGSEEGIVDEVGSGGMDGEGAGGMAFVAGGALERGFLAVEVSKVIEGWIDGEVLDDGEVAPIAVGGGFLDEKIDASDVVGKGGDVIEHGSADDIFLGADEAGVGNGDGFSLIEEATDEVHVALDFRFTERAGGVGVARRKGNDGRSPLLVNAVKADGGTEGVEFRGGEFG